MQRPTPNEKELIFPGGSMITETDLQGVITFVNRKFMHMTDYALDELIGATHSILRHPDMPKQVFKGLWETIEADKEWNGYIKNLRKDGAFYWVHVFISPKLDTVGDKVGYIVGRKVPDTNSLKKIKELYSQLKAEEKV